MEPRQIDLNVRALNALEKSWTLPALPDMVKFDLAVNSGLDATGIQQFAFGLSKDINEVSAAPVEVPRAGATSPTPRPPSTSGYTTGEQVERWWTSIGSHPAPTRVEGPASIIDWKKRAVGLGYLSPDSTGMDTSWDPAFNSVLHEMRMDDYNRRIGGDKPGPSSSIMEVAEFFDDWLSPTGLIHGAMEMGFLPDFKRINEEWDEKGFWGAVDDMLLPVLNTALLFTGIGEVAMFARGLHAAHKGLNGWQLANGALKVRNVGTLGRMAGRSADVGYDIAKMQQAGWLGARIGRSGGAVRQNVASSMAGWRQLKSTMMARKTVQQGMRLGLAGRVEDRFFDYEGHGLPQEWADDWGDLRHNPVVYLAAEMAYTPLHVLQPGQVTSPFGFVKRFASVGADAQWGEEAAAGVRHSILNPGGGDQGAVTGKTMAQREAEAGAWDKRVKEVGTTRALMDRYGLDEDSYEGWLLWMITMAAVDARSAGAVVEKSGDVARTALRFTQDFHTARNNAVSQLRYIDPDNPAELLVTLAWQTSKNATEARRKFDRYAEAVFGPQATGNVDGVMMHGHEVRRENLNKLIEIHNNNRVKFHQQLLEEQAKPGVLANQMAGALDTMGDWDGFVTEMGHVDDAFVAGDLSKAKFKEAVNEETGRRLVSTGGDVMGQQPSIFRTGEESLLTVDIVDVLNDAEFVEIAKGNVFAPLTRRAPDRGRFTVARKGTITKQDKLRDLAVIRRLLHLQNTLKSLHRGAPSNPINRQWAEVQKRADTLFTADGAGIKHIRMGQLVNIMENVGVATRDQKRMKRIVKYAQQHQIDIADVDAHLARRVGEADKSARWSSLYGIDSTLTLKHKMRELHRQAQYTAAEIDSSSIPAQLAEQLDAKGYKLVYGVEYAAPTDLAGLKVEVADLVEIQKYKQSFGLVGTPMAKAVTYGKRGVRGLGRSVQRFEPNHTQLIYRAALRSSLQRNLFAVDGPRDFRNAVGDDLSKLMDELQRIARELAGENQHLVETKHHMGALNPMKMVVNVQTSFAPAAAADLVRTKTLWNKTNDALAKLGYTEAERLAVFDGLKGARVVGPQLRGRFTNWLDKLQATPALTNTMRLLSRQRVDGGYGRKGAAFAFKNAPAVGAGHLYGRMMEQEEPDNIGDHLQGAFTAAVAATFGRTIGGKAVSKLFKDATSVASTTGRFSRLKKLDPTTALARTASHMDQSMTMKHWAYMPDRLATMRDYFRFSLSPIFDMSRYSEGMVLAQIGHLPEEVIARGGLRFNMSPTAWRKARAKQWADGRKAEENITVYFDPETKGKLLTRKEAVDAGHDVSELGKSTMTGKQAARHEWDQIVAEFSSIGKSRSDFDYEALEAGTARFRQIGVLGFNTHEWMASMYGDLTRIHGLGKAEAYDVARKAFTYGINPRSPMEMNVNTVFFPFSFMKKTVGHAAQFAMNDWSRAAMIHDALKTYEILDEKYDLEELWRDHLPILNKLQRLNLFAYGISPGELGGANRPIIDFFNSTPVADGTINPIMNILLPQGYDIRTEEDMADVEALMRRIAPMFNDMNHLLDDTFSQFHVVTGGTGMTKEAEAREGFARVSDLKQMVHQFMKDSGEPEGIGALRRQRYAPLKQWLDDAKEKIRTELPGYRDALVDVTTNSVIRAQDRRSHESAFEAFRAAGESRPMTREEKFGALLAVAGRLDDRHGHDYIPSEQRDKYLSLAASWAKDDEYIRMKWRQHLRPTWGPIETELL